MKHGDKLKYTKGDILYGIWPKPSSGETRLLVKQKDVGKKHTYDFKDYEESMFFHNKYARPYCFNTTNIPLVIQKYMDSPNNPYCSCYDCLAELNVIHEYSTVMKQNFDFSLKRLAQFMNKTKKLSFQMNMKGNQNGIPNLQGIKTTCESLAL